jgi:MFS family permease
VNRTSIATGNPGSGHRWRSLAFLCLIGLLSSVDMQLIYLLLEPIKRDLQLSDAQISIITGSTVAVVSAIAAFPIGWLADRYGRRLVLACAVLFWSLMTGLCGLARSFDEFLLASVGLAFGEAGLYAIMYALMPQIVPARERAQANAILLGVLVLSAAVGLLAGAWFLRLIEDVKISGYRSWRVALIAAGLVGPVFAAMVLGIRVTPDRPQAAAAAAAVVTHTAAPRLGAFLRNSGPLIAAIFLGLSLYGSAWSAWLVWSPALLAREFGRSAVDAGTLAGIANFVGCVLALALARSAFNRWHATLQHRFTIRTLTISCSIALFPVILLARTDSLVLFLAAFGALSTFLTLAITIAPTLVQDIAPAMYRSSVTGLMPIMALPVRIVAPVILGLISDRSGRHGLLVGVCLVSSVCLTLAATLLALTEKRYSQLATSIARQELQAAESFRPLPA